MIPASLLNRADFFWIFGIFCVAAIGVTAAAINLYHRGGGTKSTRQIVTEAVVGYFLPLTAIVRIVRKLIKHKWL